MNNPMHGHLRDYYGEPCPYCERPMIGVRAPTREHVFPKRFGGKLTEENKLIACEPCNKEKGGRTLNQFLRHLERTKDPRLEIVLRLKAQTRS